MQWHELQRELLGTVSHNRAIRLIKHLAVAMDYPLIIPSVTSLRTLSIASCTSLCVLFTGTVAIAAGALDGGMSEADGGGGGPMVVVVVVLPLIMAMAAVACLAISTALIS